MTDPELERVFSRMADKAPKRVDAPKPHIGRPLERCPHNVLGKSRCSKCKREYDGAYYQEHKSAQMRRRRVERMLAKPEYAVIFEELIAKKGLSK